MLKSVGKSWHNLGFIQYFRNVNIRLRFYYVYNPVFPHGYPVLIFKDSPQLTLFTLSGIYVSMSV